MPVKITDLDIASNDFIQIIVMLQHQAAPDFYM